VRYEATAIATLALQRFSKFPISHAVVRNQYVTFGHDAPSLCKEPLFGSICATIVQPEFQRFITPMSDAPP
jgi:hypothetical protein